MSPAANAVAACAVAFFATLAHAEPQAGKRPAQPSTAAQNGSGTDTVVQVCFGGLQGGKVIVRSGDVVEDALETTAKACRIDGGHQADVPRSPIIPAGSGAIT